MPARESYKKGVVEWLFRQRWDPVSQTLSNSLVTLENVAEAIRAYNAQTGTNYSDRNPANFFKDFVRKAAFGQRNWPESAWSAGYTARQVTGHGRCFEFVPAAPGQSQPFVPVPGPTPTTPRYQIATASLPLTSRRLGRSDEAWLIQVLVRLHVLETHLSLFSPRRQRIRQVDHLQMSVKLNMAEIDALFLALEQSGSGPITEVLVSCEAKGRNDDLLYDQIRAQVLALFHQTRLSQESIIPLGVRTVGISTVHVVEFDAVSRHAAQCAFPLTIVKDVIYELLPQVPGIG